MNLRGWQPNPAENKPLWAISAAYWSYEDSEHSSSSHPKYLLIAALAKSI